MARGANGNAHDNRAIAAETLALRDERAKLLGYASFADYKLEPEMAKTPAAVRDLLMRVWEPAKRKADGGCGGAGGDDAGRRHQRRRWSHGTGAIIPKSAGRPSMIWMRRR